MINFWSNSKVYTAIASFPQMIGTPKSNQRFFFISKVHWYCTFSSVMSWKRYMTPSLREKCPNTEFFLVCIFPHSDWIRRDTSYFSVFSPNVENTDKKKLRIGYFSRSAYDITMFYLLRIPSILVILGH